MSAIAFIGLGNMGIGMATNLAKAGHDVRALDLSEEAVVRAVTAGCKGARNTKDAVEAADVVVTMLPAGAHVKMVYGGEDGVFAHAREGTLFIDCSTIDVASAREVIGSATHKGFEMIDAPVSGGVGGALVQLAKRRGARVIAMASDPKHADVAALGPDALLSRAPENLRAALENEKVTVVAAVVGNDMVGRPTKF